MRSSRRNRTRTAALLSLAMALIINYAPAVGADDFAGEPGRSSGGPNPLKNVYFGEQHMHTRNSFDAFTLNVRTTWEDAYRYGRGEEVKISTTGEKIKRGTPYDFVAITDHSEYYGVLKDLIDPSSPLSKSEFAKGFASGIKDPKVGGHYVSQLIGTLLANTPMQQYVTPELRKGNWQEFVDTANKFNDPGKFTAQIAYEWTSIPNGRNMHRNLNLIILTFYKFSYHT